MSVYLFVLLALAVAPGGAIATYVWWRDKYEREPLAPIIISFILGALAIIPALVLELTGEKIFGKMNGSNIFSASFHAYFVVGFSEELCKLAALMIYAFRSKEFNEPMDGIVYSVMVSMGYATLENVFYVLEGGIGSALLRMFLAVPAHASFAVIMGFYVGRGKAYRVGAVTSRDKPWLKSIIYGLLGAAFLHGTYDFFLFLENIPLLALGAIASLWVGIKLSLAAIDIYSMPNGRWSQ